MTLPDNFEERYKDYFFFSWIVPDSSPITVAAKSEEEARAKAIQAISHPPVLVKNVVDTLMLILETNPALIDAYMNTDAQKAGLERLGIIL